MQVYNINVLLEEHFYFTNCLYDYYTHNNVYKTRNFYTVKCIKMYKILISSIYEKTTKLVFSYKDFWNRNKTSERIMKNETRRI